jgi:hypothetical protein
VGDERCAVRTAPITNRQAELEAITNWKDNHDREALIAAMATVVQQIQGLFGKLFVGIKPA